MKIWTLMENTACREALHAEHGLSLYIETGGSKLLFDAGQSGGFADNARKMGIDLRLVDIAILSHGHYDHGGGMRRFLALNQRARIYANQDAFQPHYNADGRDIGLDTALADTGRIVPVGERLILGDGLSLHACNTLLKPYPADSFGLQMEEGGILQPDDFRHEQYLLAEEQGKRILFSGCSHKGILNIVHWFRPDVLVGGFHFAKLDAEDPYLSRAAERLLEYPTVYYTGHCTGQAQYEKMKGLLGDRLHRLRAGTVITL